MSRYRLLPSPVQEAMQLDHCANARYMWNLAVEQHSHWHTGRKSAPGYLEQCRQLTAARSGHPWLAAGSQMVQQQALRDFAQAMTAFLDPANPAGRPSWRKAGRDEGFRVVALKPGEVRRLSRHIGLIRVPKAGWIRFRWSRAVPAGVTWREQARLKRLERKLARAKRGSARRRQVRLAIARLRARETDRRKDWAEQRSTDIARRFDLIKVEDLQIKNMTRSAKGTREVPGRRVRQKAGLNRGILRSGWGLLVRRREQKAPGRMEKVNPAFTSQRCSACGHVDPKSRESQAVFRCTACGYVCHADVNAAINIAAGHAVTARGGYRDTGPVNREPHLLTS